MASPTSTSIPSDHNAPLAVVNANDHSAWILICSAFGLTVVVITLIIRIYIRVRVSPPFGADDYTLAGATALAVVQVGVVFGQVEAGFGKSIDLISQSQLVRIQEFGYAADLLFIAGIYASKCCVVLFFKRISPSRATAISTWAVLLLCLAFLIASTLTVSLRCDLSHPWLSYEETCTGLVPRWRGVAALDIASEVLLFAMSLHLVWDLQTSIARKSKVVFAFALRLLVILTAGVRLQYVEQQVHSADPTLSGAITAVLTEVELIYAVMAATIPCLRPFLAAFVTNYGAMGGDTIMRGSHIGGSRTGGSRTKDSKKSTTTSFALQSLESARRAMGRHEKYAESSEGRNESNTGDGMLRPDPVGNRISAGHGKGPRSGEDTGSLGSDRSTRGMIIRKELAWQVDNESFRTRSVSDVQPTGEQQNVDPL